jgi:hypothetical protein
MFCPMHASRICVWQMQFCLLPASVVPRPSCCSATKTRGEHSYARAIAVDVFIIEVREKIKSSYDLLRNFALVT